MFPLRFRHVAPVALCVAFAAPVLAWTHTFEDPGIKGTLFSGSGDVLSTDCHMLVDRPPEQVVAALTDYDRIGEWLPDTVEYKVLKREGLNATWYRHSRTPFFMKKLWATVEATVTSTDGKTKVVWHRVDGTITVFDAVWEVEAAPGGSAVTYRVSMSVPLALPGFILKRAGADAILDTLRGLRTMARNRK